MIAQSKTFIWQSWQTPPSIAPKKNPHHHIENKFSSFASQRNKKWKWKHLHIDFLRNWISYEKLQLLFGSALSCCKAKRHIAPLAHHQDFFLPNTFSTFQCDVILARLKHYSRTHRSLIVIDLSPLAIDGSRSFCTASHIAVHTTPFGFKFLISFRIYMHIRTTFQSRPLKFHAFVLVPAIDHILIEPLPTFFLFRIHKSLMKLFLLKLQSTDNKFWTYFVVLEYFLHVHDGWVLCIDWLTGSTSVYL